jgi:hypothetical protein
MLEARVPAVRVVEMKLRIFILLFMLSQAAPGATTSAASSQPDSPDLVEVGVWFNSIHTIDFLDGSFGAEFYLWWISADPDFHPFEIFQVLNGREWTVRSVNRHVLPDGAYYTSGYVSVTINHDWDLLYYPFDRQKLPIIIETPFVASKLRLVPNQRDSVVSEFMDVEGFQIVGLDLQEHVEEYETDFGYRDKGGRQFSRFVMELELKRESRRLAVVILLGFIVANLIALLTYALHVSMLGTRASMVTAAVFSAIGNMYFITSKVHPAAGSLIVDRFAVGTFTAILVALLNGIIIDRLVRWEKIGLARSINWTVFTLVVVGSGVFYRLIIEEAMR